MIPSQSPVMFLLTDPPSTTTRNDSPSGRSAPPWTPLWQQAMMQHGGTILASSPTAALGAVFASPDAALAAALQLQRAWLIDLAPEYRPFRMALHSGPSGAVGDVYFGATLNRTEALLAACDPGQIVLSQQARSALSEELPDAIVLQPIPPARLADLLPAETFFVLIASDLPTPPTTIRAIDSYPTNLPVQPTPFLGREQELAALVQHIQHEQQRLITLIAPSGHGKTRFSLAAATHLLDTFPDGVFFVSLAPITDPALVIPTIAQTLGLKNDAVRSDLEQLQAYLHTRRVLLLLDNFEQVVMAAPELEALLRATEHLTMIVSSHVPLQIPQEHLMVVPPLAVPHGRSLPPIEQLVENAAIALFLERLQAVEPDFVLDEAQAQLIVRICQLLGGVPLAIELVAAYGDTISLDELVTQLQSRSPTGMVTLLQVLEWSYAQLAPTTQTLFARLGIFLEGCTLDGAEAVCQIEATIPLDVLDEIGILLQRNLLLEEQLADGELRYIMLDCIHDEAYRHMVIRGEEAILQARHARYYATLAEPLEDALQGPNQTSWLQRIQGELNNFRAALRWAIAQHDGVIAVNICSGLWLFWVMRGFLREGLQWCEAALALGTHTPSRSAAWALNGAGALATVLGHYQQASTFYQQALDLYQALDDQVGIANVLSNFGMLAQYQEDYAQAKAYYLKSIAAQADIMSIRNVTAISRLNLGGIFSNDQQYQEAERYLREALAIASELNDQRVVIFALLNLGQMHLAQDKSEAAAAFFHEGLQLCRSYGKHEVQDWLLVGAATIAHTRGRHLEAARLFGAAEAHLPGGQLPTGVIAVERAALREQIYTSCNPRDADNALTAGRALTLDQALTFAIAETAAR